ncbi:hypothetical protein NM208_g13620 [Fusarium decemcellulare]|uniref:Uncharacterized protein n=1 Tax=Fusarium decemcellulare TaxID=57161 RepID=A0ACC1RL16_9HYPO|nr:hypothetical protein NM208_g13620 [Fusarium decemcellulare]
MSSNSSSGRYSTDLLEVPGVAFDVEIADPTERIQAYLDSYQASVPGSEAEGFDDKLMREHLQLISALSSNEKTTVSFLLRPGPNLLNRLGNVHGGAVALVYDMCTTMCTAPIARKGFWQFGGVSRSLAVTYLRPVKADMEILIECEVLQIGTRLATIRGQMRDRLTGNLLSVAEHHKASIEFAEPKAKV